jgi:hypothetical protein
MRYIGIIGRLAIKYAGISDAVRPVIIEQPFAFFLKPESRVV